MSIRLSGAVLISIALVTPAVSQQPVKLTCDGTWNNQQRTPPENSPVRGIYVEITGAQVKILGSIMFDGTHRVTKSDERILFFELDERPGVQGNINRQNGDLVLLMILGDRVAHTVEARCRLSAPLF